MVVRWITAVLLVLFGACGLDQVTEQAKKDQAERKADALGDVELTSCGLEDGRMTAGLEVVNGSSERSNYSVKVAFTSPDGGEQYDTGRSYVSGLAPGQSTREQVRAFEDPPAAFDCGVVDVFRLSDE